MSDRCRVPYPRPKSTEASPRSQSPTPPRLRRAYSQTHLPPASAPSSADRPHSSLDSSLSPGDASRRSSRCLYRRYSPQNVGDRSGESPPCKSPRLAGQRYPAEGGGEVQGHVPSASSPDPSLFSTDCSPEYRTGQDSQFDYDQLSETSLDVTTESEAAQLFPEEVDVEAAAPNQGIATAKVSSSAMDSVDTDNANAWVPTTEILQSPPAEMGSQVFPPQLWCDQQASSQVPTAQLGSTTLQFVKSMEIGRTTYYLFKPPYQSPPLLYPAPHLSGQSTVHPMVWGLQTPTTRFQVVEPTPVYQFPGAQQSVPMMGIRGVVQTETRVLGPVPIPGTSYPPIQSPYQTYPYSQSSFLPTNQPPNLTVFASPAASREVLPFMVSFTHQFPHPLRTGAAAGAAGVRSTVIYPSGPVQTLLTSRPLHSSFPDTLPISTATYSAVNEMLATPSSSTKSTAPASSVETSMLSNLSDFRASAGLKDEPKEVSQTEVSSVVNKEPVCSEEIVGDVAETRETMVAAVGDIRSRISSNVTDFVLTTIRSHLIAHEENSRASVQTTELPKVMPYQMTESSADPCSNFQQPVTIMDTAPKMVHESSSVSTPSANPSLKSTVLALPKSSEQPTAPMPSVEISMLSNLSDFRASTRGRGTKSRRIAKTVLSSARHEDHSMYITNTEPSSPGINLTRTSDAQGSRWLPLSSDDVQNKGTSSSVSKPVPPAVTDAAQSHGLSLDWILATNKFWASIPPSPLSSDVQNKGTSSSVSKPVPPAVTDAAQSHGSSLDDWPLASNPLWTPIPPMPRSSDDVQNKETSSSVSKPVPPAATYKAQSHGSPRKDRPSSSKKSRKPVPPSGDSQNKETCSSVSKPVPSAVRDKAHSHRSPRPDRPVSSNRKPVPPPIQSGGFRMTGLPSWQRWVSRHPFPAAPMRRRISQAEREAYLFTRPPQPPGFVPDRQFPQIPVSVQAARGQIMHARNPPFPRPQRLPPAFAARPRMSAQPRGPLTQHSAPGPAPTRWHRRSL